MLSYRNRKTFEVTTYRHKCRQWLRAGDEVEVWRDDKLVMSIPKNYFEGRIVPRNDILFFGI